MEPGIVVFKTRLGRLKVRKSDQYINLAYFFTKSETSKYLKINHLSVYCCLDVVILANYGLKQKIIMILKASRNLAKVSKKVVLSLSKPYLREAYCLTL